MLVDIGQGSSVWQSNQRSIIVLVSWVNYLLIRVGIDWQPKCYSWTVLVYTCMGCLSKFRLVVDASKIPHGRLVLVTRVMPSTTYCIPDQPSSRNQYWNFRSRKKRRDNGRWTGMDVAFALMVQPRPVVTRYSNIFRILLTYEISK